MSGESIARELGKDSANVRKKIRSLKKSYPELPWYEDVRQGVVTHSVTKPKRWSVNVAKSKAVVADTVVILPDIHGHLADKPALGCALGYITENKIDKVIVSGDGIDLPSMSHFKKSLNDEGFLAQELEVGRGIRQAIDTAAGKAEKMWLEGNHERRSIDYRLLIAKAYQGVEETNIDQLLNLPQNGWEYIPTTAGKSTYTYVGSVCVGHFDLSRKVAGSAALSLMNDRNESVLQSHTHKIGGGLKRFPNGRTIMGYEIGCLCDLSPSYCTDPTWAHGFAILRRVKGSNRFDFHQVNIIGGEAMIDGVRYTA